MSTSRTNRRAFLKSSAAVAATGTVTPYFFSTTRTSADEPQSKNDRLQIGAIGVGGMGRGDAGAAGRFGDVVAVCDVDRNHAERARDADNIGRGKADIYEDYRQLLERQDIDVVTISTPDHWHTKMVIEALRAGKDIYVQKPLTLTIDEGIEICRVVKETQRVVQVGSQQRSDGRFQTAVALTRSGRLGEIKTVSAALGAAPRGGPFQTAEVPGHLQWDKWLGPAPLVEYIPQRCHGNFRWWYEYSGGKITDWGAHHVDIATWAIGEEGSGPVSIEPIRVDHPVEMKNGMPTRDDSYNTAVTFKIKCVFASGTELIIREDTDNGVLIEGSEGRVFVNRGRVSGAPVEQLESNPLPEEDFVALRKGRSAAGHMANFIACVKDRGEPISDVFSHHRALTTCHLANIAIRLGRKLTWDPAQEQIVGDDEARSFQSRPYRSGYEIES